MTIKEVAQLAGVSSAAVSRYMNGGPLSREKKERIAEAIRITGYRPNIMAQTMRTGRIRQIGIIVPKIFSESVSQIMNGIAEELSEKNYMTVLGYTDSREDRELEYLDIMQSNRVAGIILMGTTMTPAKAEALKRCEVPIVITGQNFTGFPCVYHDDFNAVRELTAHMIRRGRRRIVFIGVTEKDAAAGLARRQGVQEAMREAGLDAENMLRTVSGFDSDSGYEKMNELLEIKPDLDGVVCATDSIALGAIRALRERGRRIPEDVSIAGVGDSWADTICQPTLTTAHLFYRQCGHDAARMLLHRINDDEEATPVRQMMLEYSIIERGSV